MKADSSTFGVAKVIINNYLHYISEDHLKQRAMSFFAKDSVLEFDGAVFNNIVSIHQGLKTIPPFTYNITNFDCMNVPNLPISMIILTGFAFFEQTGETKRFITTLYVIINGNSAIIKNQIFNFIN